jgi:hypothetical protein
MAPKAKKAGLSCPSYKELEAQLREQCEATARATEKYKSLKKNAGTKSQG